MKIILYSDLHLEFGKPFDVPAESSADVMILAGDIITFADFSPLEEVVKSWRKPILYVAGNHEFYTRKPMQEDVGRFQTWAADYSHLHFLQDEAISIDGVHFFGGTMWTDFNSGDSYFMNRAMKRMNDYRMIKVLKDAFLDPALTIKFHEVFKANLLEWFSQPLRGSRVVISHHVPMESRETYNAKGDAYLAYLALDMEGIIKEHKPDLWVYGHNHIPSNMTIGNTRLVSNPRGYPTQSGGFQCIKFDRNGVGIEI